LEGCKHGELHLHVTWLNLSTNPRNLERDEWENQWITSDKPIHPALLMVFIDSVSNLPYPKANLEPSPFIEATLGRISQRTPVKVKTVNPLFQTKFLFFVKQPEGQELKLKAIDDGTRRELGDLTIPLYGVLKQPNMELYQHTFQLVQGIHNSSIVVTIRLRTFVPPDPILDSSFDSSTSAIYGTGSHIERAEKKNKLAKDMNQNNTVNNQEFQPTDNHSSVNYVLNDRDNSVASPEPGKTVDDKHGNHSLVPEQQLNTSNFSSLHRSPSSVTASSATTTNTSQFRSGHTIVDRMKAGKRRKKSRQHVVPGSSLGQLQIGLKYDDESFKLFVDVVCAKELIPVEKTGLADPYVSIKLVPLDSSTGVKPPNKGKGKTSVVKNSLNPYFDFQHYFDVHFTELQKYKLQLLVKDDLNYGTFTSPPVLGVVEISLANFEPKKVIANQWVDLAPG
jgi:hypothetical protein